MSFIKSICSLCLVLFTAPPIGRAGNPIITDMFTADPAAIVHQETVYLYAGQDEAAPNSHYRINRWLCYSSKDMKSWTAHGSPLQVSSFAWAVRDAYASHVLEKDGKFYWYVSIEHDNTKPGKAIGVAVADSPTGPFKDPRGSALVTADMTNRGRHGWEDIDPAVFIDTDGTAYLFWGNRYCYYAKLKSNMIELDGEIMPVHVPLFTEAPWIHQHGDVYYLSYATGFPEKIAYATSSDVNGPWTYRGLLAEVAGNSNTIHQSIIEFKQQWYFIYHNAALPGGDSYRRSVCIDYLYHQPNGMIKRIVQSTEGTDLSPAREVVPDTAPLPAWVRIRAMNRQLFVRHSDYTGTLSPWPMDPMEDAMWKLLPGLSDATGVSIESVNFPGHFLRQLDGKLILAKSDGTPSFQSAATFVEEPGLADPARTSFRSAGPEKHFLYVSENALRIGPVDSPADRLGATFEVLREGGGSDLKTKAR